jgi:hypothetical protein
MELMWHVILPRFSKAQGRTAAHSGEALMARYAFLWLFSALALLAPTRAFAQEVPLSQLLVNLIQADVRLAPPAAGFPSHEAHFLPGANQALAPYLFNQQLVAQLATFPIGSPTGGFAFTFDPQLGTFQRATDSFGPAFADRALTNGRQRLTLGANFQYSKYTTFEGNKLDNGDVKFYLDHEDLPGDLFFEGDLIEAALKLDLSSTTTTIFANYGVTNSFDLAIAVPIVRVKMDATIDAQVLRLATPGQQIHAFLGGTTSRSFSDSGSASGIGDLLVRAKYRFVSVPGGGLAAGVDVRLPSGDAENLLGTGAAGFGVTLIGSSARGRLAPHFNVGFSASGDSDVVNIANEFGYKFGTEIVAAPTVTFSVDLLGRSLIDAGRLELTDTVHNYRNADNVAGSITLGEYVAQEGALNLLGLALGGKFNVTGNLLINADVLIGLTDSGITPRFTPVLGFDYSF